MKTINYAVKTAYGFVSMIFLISSLDKDLENEPVDLQVMFFFLSWIATGLWINTFRNEPAE